MIQIVMKSLVLLMLVFGTVAADAEEKRLDDIKTNLQRKINGAVHTDNFAKVLREIRDDDVYEVLGQLPLEDRKKLCELMPPSRIVEYYQRLPVEDRIKVQFDSDDELLNDDDRLGKLDEFLRTLPYKVQREVNDHFNKTSILELYQGFPIPNNDFRFLGRQTDEIRKTLHDREKNEHLYNNLVVLPVDQKLRRCKDLSFEKLRDVLKASSYPIVDDYDIAGIISALKAAMCADNTDNIEKTYFEDLEETQEDNNTEGTEDAELKEKEEDNSPWDEEGNGYEEPFFKQIIEIQLGQSKGINVEQTPEIQK
ncbi:uncharacterized protein LOC124122923 [Haliotis rufescens]|uniref:uncharacterized protein LOC124122923 n=1 Tax=Haliotis rufescens TaxID=6454 RepID=UPI00201E8898|nr:uncharacterized protein LOC124122923 [Haliotis rufescens]